MGGFSRWQMLKLYKKRRNRCLELLSQLGENSGLKSRCLRNGRSKQTKIMEWHAHAARAGPSAPYPPLLPHISPRSVKSSSATASCSVCSKQDSKKFPTLPLHHRGPQQKR